MANTLLNQQPEGILLVPPVVLDGPLQRLKTVAMIEASEATVDVYIVEIHPKATKLACDAMKPLLPEGHKKINLAHLRRPCTYAQLPEVLKQSELFSSIKSKSQRNKGGNKTNFIMLCASCLVDEQTLLDAIVKALPAPEYEAPSSLYEIEVPLFPPVSTEQAEEWSRRYWPTSFKNNNPYGPHPAVIAKAEAQLMSADHLSPETCMKLARLVASDSQENAMGQPAGVVVVERLEDGPARIVVVASDGRYRGFPAAEADWSCGGPGNIQAHAAMRAIAMVAQKRRIIDGKTEALPEEDITIVTEADGFKTAAKVTEPSTISCLDHLPQHPSDSDISLDVPMTEREKRYFDPPTLTPHGYLSLGLELYITHEPCVQCSFAILHSRLGRVVFEKPMPLTGALMAERPDESPVLKAPETVESTQRATPATRSAKRRQSRKNAKIRAIEAAVYQQKARSPPLIYGLFWRPQLNWKFFCWQWRQDRAGSKEVSTVLISRKSSSSSEDGSASTSRSRGQSSSGSSQAAVELGIEDLADDIRCMSIVHISDSVHI